MADYISLWESIGIWDYIHVWEYISIWDHITLWEYISIWDHNEGCGMIVAKFSGEYRGEGSYYKYFKLLIYYINIPPHPSLLKARLHLSLQRADFSSNNTKTSPQCYNKNSLQIRFYLFNNQPKISGGPKLIGALFLIS